MTRRPKLNPGNAVPERPDSKVITRFLEKIAVCSETGCWLWTAYKDENGYGQISWRGTAFWAHRMAYVIFNGPIPAGDHVDHIDGCSSSCMNPDHLRLLTHSENSIDGSRRRWGTKKPDGGIPI